MKWALAENDPENWLGHDGSALYQANKLVEENDGDFSYYSYYYQYNADYPDRDRFADRGLAEPFAKSLETRLQSQQYLLGESFSVADAAIIPFVRGFARADHSWFENSYSKLTSWVSDIESSDLFKIILG